MCNIRWQIFKNIRFPLTRPLLWNWCCFVSLTSITFVLVLKRNGNYNTIIKILLPWYQVSSDFLHTTDIFDFFYSLESSIQLQERRLVVCVSEERLHRIEVCTHHLHFTFRAQIAIQHMIPSILKIRKKLLIIFNFSFFSQTHGGLRDTP